MTMNRVQFQPGLSMVEFMDRYRSASGRSRRMAALAALKSAVALTSKNCSFTPRERAAAARSVGDTGDLPARVRQAGDETSAHWVRHPDGHDGHAAASRHQGARR